MRDYSMTINETKEFILDYKIDGDKLTIYYANGDKKTVSYTSEEEKRILRIMKFQVLNADEYIKFQTKLSKASSSLVTVNFFLILSYLMLNGSGLGLGSLIGSFILSGLVNVESSLNLEDVHKNTIFIHNAEILNKNLKINRNFLGNISKSAKKRLEKVLDREEDITLHTIRSISDKDMEKLIKSMPDGFILEEHNDSSKQYRK